MMSSQDARGFYFSNKCSCLSAPHVAGRFHASDLLPWDQRGVWRGHAPRPPCLVTRGGSRLPSSGSNLTSFSSPSEHGKLPHAFFGGSSTWKFTQAFSAAFPRLSISGPSTYVTTFYTDPVPRMWVPSGSSLWTLQLAEGLRKAFWIPAPSGGVTSGGFLESCLLFSGGFPWAQVSLSDLRCP